ncbi:MAG: Coenzyme F420 hydrogenase/dehydrogenase, beta subunit C-terminal domain [Ruminococcus sp.]|nr:Coenzyme F420 hydrogenase/dehydrogenase, beta subunit C-terminal domain [Ruminococcus sp.]
MNLADKKVCTGCGACANACPNNCIEMMADEHGFEYPVINEQKCVQCHLCERACPVGKSEKETHSKRAYAMINNDENERMNSSSGGVFSLVAKAVLNDNGVVFGAAFDEQMHVRHDFCESPDELYKYQGSKYVQSSIGYSYRDAGEFLKSGRKVLFTGTPCQIEGLKQYLEALAISAENLLAVDIICHGVPAPEVWHRYREFKEAENGSKITDAQFRSKVSGWKDFSMKLDFEKGNQSVTKVWDDLYVGSFLRNLCLRESCYACPSKGNQKRSDITLADFWGISQEIPEFNDDKGVSFVVVNSEKGQHFIDDVSRFCNFREVSFEQGVKHNKSWYMSASKPKMADYFMSNYKKKPFDKVALKSAKKTGIWKVLRALRGK